MQTFIRTACEKHRLLLVMTIGATITLKILALAPPLLLGKIVDSLNDADHTTLRTLLFFTAAFTLAGCIQSMTTPCKRCCSQSSSSELSWMLPSIGWRG
ncbi:hypothetical protein [Pseudomonas sp. ef1]